MIAFCFPTFFSQFLTRIMFFYTNRPLWRAADQSAQAGFSGIMPFPPATGCHRNSNARGLKYLMSCYEWCPVPMSDNVIGHRVLPCLHHTHSLNLAVHQHTVNKPWRQHINICIKENHINFIFILTTIFFEKYICVYFNVWSFFRKT